MLFGWNAHRTKTQREILDAVAPPNSAPSRRWVISIIASDQQPSNCVGFPDEALGQSRVLDWNFFTEVIYVEELGEFDGPRCL